MARLRTALGFGVRLAGQGIGLSLVLVLGFPELAGASLENITSVPPVTGSVFASAVEGSAEPASAVQRRRRRRRRRGQRNPTPERIREIQAALIKAEYLEGKPNGVWDEGTAGAMEDFQRDNEFRVTGKPDALSLIKLGLGSPTAGVGAPRKTVQQDGTKSPPEKEKSGAASGTDGTEN